MKPKKGDTVYNIAGDVKGKIKEVSKGYAYIDFGIPGYFQPYPIRFMELDLTRPKRTWKLV